MKIGIVTYFFPPDLNPRSFRAFELAKEFSKQGHEVRVYVPDHDQDFRAICNSHGFAVIKVPPGFYLNKKSRNRQIEKNDTNHLPSPKKISPSLLSKFKAWLIRMLYPGGFNFEFAFTCSKVLVNEKQEFEILLSIGLPICSHLAISRARRKKKNLANFAVADYGDPYSFSEIIKPPRFHRWLEKKMLRQFDYILTPTDNGVDSFLFFKDRNHIKVVPQGINFGDVKVSTSHNNEKTIHFIYAGNFYEGARNPFELFDYLSTLEINFKFSVYTNIVDEANSRIIQAYRTKLNGKLEVKPYIERLDCIYEMSKADFLVNISNTTMAHTPSKLIDYKLAGRPIYSYTPGHFYSDKLDAFLSRNYQFDFSTEIDLERYNIKNIVGTILNLTLAE